MRIDVIIRWVMPRPLKKGEKLTQEKREYHEKRMPRRFAWLAAQIFKYEPNADPNISPSGRIVRVKVSLKTARLLYSELHDVNNLDFPAICGRWVRDETDRVT